MSLLHIPPYRIFKSAGHNPPLTFDAQVVLKLLREIVLVELSICRLKIKVRLKLKGGGFRGAHNDLPTATVPGPAVAYKYKIKEGAGMKATPKYTLYKHD